MNKIWILPALLSTSMLVACGNNTETEMASETTDGALEVVMDGPKFDLITTPVGDVNFPSSCNAVAAPLVERGVALMHNMMYTEAQFVFSMADDADPKCAMSYWGQAMAQIHPLWGDVLDAEDFAHGLELTTRGQSVEGLTLREQNFLKTTEAFYTAGDDINMRGGYERISAAWGDISNQMPDDMDAQAFNALFKVAISSNDAERLEAGQIALDILDTMPNHPGGHHYVIHAFDTATLAKGALETADHYGEITPKVPHSSHMMTHTYTRLGAWDKAITWNNISAGTALELCIDNGVVNTHYPHAMDYLMFAHLQKGDDAAAAQIEKEMFELDIAEFEETGRGAISYAYASIPVRYSLERQDWDRAISLQPRVPSHFPWIEADNRDVSNTHFARGLGFSRLGRPDEATAEIVILEDMIGTLNGINGAAYYQQKINNQILAVRAWQHFARGEVDQALTLMEKASQSEATNENAPSNPGDMLPAEELLGDMLFEASRFEEAHAAYALSLERSPGRYNSIYGAAITAFELGDMVVAKKYFSLLVKNSEGGSSQRASLNDARTKLASIN